MQTAGFGDFRKAQEACFYRTLANLSERFGPDFKLNLLGQKMVVVGETTLIRDLMTKNASRLVKGRTLSEVTAMTQQQILTQAATSVLAQANSAPQAILKLLQ